MGQEFVPTNLDLGDILGGADFDVENLYFGIGLDSKFPDFQVLRFPKFGLGQAGLGPWARWALGGRVGPRAGPRVGHGLENRQYRDKSKSRVIF